MELRLGDGAAERRVTLGQKTERRRLYVELYEHRETLRGKVERRSIFLPMMAPRLSTDLN